MKEQKKLLFHRLVFFQIVEEDPNERDDNVVLLTEDDLTPARKIVWDNEDYKGHPYQVVDNLKLSSYLSSSNTYELDTNKGNRIFQRFLQFNINFTPLRLTAQALEGVTCDRTEFKPYSEVTTFSFS